jgi:hypothetical protein
VDPKDFLSFQIVPSTSERTVAILVHPSHNTTMGTVNNSGFQLEPKRMAVSGRRTLALQGIGLASIKAKINDLDMEDPHLFGYSEDYTRVGCWRSPGLGVLSRPNTGTDANITRRTLSQIMQIPEPSEEEEALFTARVIPPFDFKRYQYVRRTFDRLYWPSPNTNAISSRKSLAEMMVTGYVMMLLALDGILPIVCSPNPQDKLQTIKVTFGPLLDSNHNPVVPGRRYQASFIYIQSRMKNSVDHHDAWHPNYWWSETVILRLVAKSGLPVDVDIVDGMSPVGELMRIDKGLPRTGFSFHGSGGGSVITGLAPPDAKARKTISKEAAEGATFETAQTVMNKNNRTMEQICESGRAVKVYLSGDVVPVSMYDSELEKSIGAGTEQAVYMGLYNVRWCAQQDVKTPLDLLEIMEFYKTLYPHLKGQQLRFLLESSKKFQLVPNNDYPFRKDGYQHLEVDTRDDRKPLHAVPSGDTIERIFKRFESPGFVSERTMFKQWVDGRGYLELVEEPFRVVNNAAEPQGTDQDEDGIALQHDFELKLRPIDLAAAEDKVVANMAHRRRRTQRFEDHWANLIICSLAAFARMVQINLDSDNKIGPLFDYKEECHSSLPTVSNYIRHFGSDPESCYLSLLGREVQMSPTTHPIRTYDPKILLLMQCNNGPDARRDRPGRTWVRGNIAAATDLFFQCILVEVVKVEVLLEWSSCFHGTYAKKLPTLVDIPCFLDFVVAILRKDGAASTNWVTHDQYMINENFKNRTMFLQFFNYLQTELLQWFSQLLLIDVMGTDDLFGTINIRLTKFINDDQGIGDASTKQPFHCQHMLMNFNEVVADFPFGEPVSPVVGFGGAFGAQLLQKKVFQAHEPKMVQPFMKRLLHLYCQQTPNDLQMLGLEKIDGLVGIFVVANKRPLGVCDPEHGCCIQYPVIERASGGSKGQSSRPKLASSYCHPVPGCTFVIGMKIATEGLKMFKHLVDTKQWRQTCETEAMNDVEQDDSIVEDNHPMETADKCDEHDEPALRTILGGKTYRRPRGWNRSTGKRSRRLLPTGNVTPREETLYMSDDNKDKTRMEVADKKDDDDNEEHLVETVVMDEEDKGDDYDLEEKFEL